MTELSLHELLNVAFPPREPREISIDTVGRFGKWRPPVGDDEDDAAKKSRTYVKAEETVEYSDSFSYWYSEDPFTDEDLEPEIIYDDVMEEEEEVGEPEIIEQIEYVKIERRNRSRRSYTTTSWRRRRRKTSRRSSASHRRSPWPGASKPRATQASGRGRSPTPLGRSRRRSYRPDRSSSKCSRSNGRNSSRAMRGTRSEHT
jgi:hypothetical protein